MCPEVLQCVYVVRVPELLCCWTVYQDMHHGSLCLVTEGAGGRGCKSYSVHVLGESCVMAAAKPGQVDAVLPRERYLGRGNLGRAGTQ